MWRNHRNLSSPTSTSARVWSLSGVAALFIASSATTVGAQISNPCENPAPADFTSPLQNPYFPLTPGTTFVYNGSIEGQPAQTVTQVTNNTKTILGIQTTVVHDVLSLCSRITAGNVCQDAVIAEDTFDWYAADNAGNVCYFGEDTKELDANGNVISTEGSWQAGQNGAQPGAIMLASPQVGDSYAQEHAAGVAEDQSTVRSLTKSIKGKCGSFDDVLLTRESTPLDAHDVGDKYYAPDVGLIVDVAKKGGRERFELVAVNGTCPAQ
jgi:hypothetical protein